VGKGFASWFRRIHYQGRNLRWEIGVTHPKKHSNYKKFYAEILQPIFKNAALRETFYAWTAPNYKRIFKMLPSASQKLYLEIIDDALAFLKNYDYKKELKYYKKLASKGQLENFAKQENPKNKDKTYQNCPRSLSAFIFRRIHNSEMTQAELLDFGTRFASILKEK
jgi:hypothetical protein